MGRGRSSSGRSKSRAGSSIPSAKALEKYASSGPEKLSEELTGYHDGQSDMVVYARNPKTNQLLGYVQYSDYDGKAHIDMIAVREELRGQGIGKRMISRVQAGYRTPINWGGTTPDGTALKRSWRRTLRSL